MSLTVLDSRYKWDHTVFHFFLPGLFRWAQCPPSLFMLSQRAGFSPFYKGCVASQCTPVLHFLHPFIRGGTRGIPVSRLLWITLQWSWEGRYLSDSDFNSSGRIPADGGLLDHMVILFIIFWGNLPIVFHNGYTQVWPRSSFTYQIIPQVTFQT